MKISPLERLVLAHELSIQHDRYDPATAAYLVSEAKIDANPHQLEAAVFALNSLNKGGGILADEVGLGKTIEAGLVISQLWAESRRRILVICPLALRGQWQRELEQLFFLTPQAVSIDDWKGFKKLGSNPVLQKNGIFILNDHIVAQNAELFRAARWDVVVIDEAHRLRSVYKTKSDQAKKAKGIRSAFNGVPKLLLTATPFQNNLDELFGLVTFVDESFFGSYESFRRIYSDPKKGKSSVGNLADRISPIFQRTLRREVATYLHFTERIASTFRYDYRKDSHEHDVHRDIMALLRSEQLLLNFKKRRTFYDLIYMKLLGSSPHALNPALLKMLRNLFWGIVRHTEQREVFGKLLTHVRDLFAGYPRGAFHYETLAKLTCGEVQLSFDSTRKHVTKNDADERVDEDTLFSEELSAESDAVEDLSQRQQEVREALKNESLIKEQCDLIILNYFRTLEPLLTGRCEAFLVALRQHLESAKDRGHPRKAVVFTEYDRTMRYLSHILSKSGLNKIPVFEFHGQLSSQKDSTGYSERDRLVSRFRDAEEGIFICTEAGAEGLNLQFANLVINFDLPWNPQRIEQRIGRCHRYGQKNDVYVINFIANENPVEQHIYEVLSEKFKLFEGMFGASNEILGQIEEGLDFEKAIGRIYLNARTREDIERELSEFTKTSSETKSSLLKEAYEKLLQGFSSEVVKTLKITDEVLKQINAKLDFRSEQVRKFLLSGLQGVKFEYDESTHSFIVSDDPKGEFASGSYTFSKYKANDKMSLITARSESVQRRISEVKANGPLRFTYELPANEELFELMRVESAERVCGWTLLWEANGYYTFQRLIHLVSINGAEACIYNSEHPLVQKLFSLLESGRLARQQSTKPELPTSPVLSGVLQGFKSELGDTLERRVNDEADQRLSRIQKAIQEQRQAVRIAQTDFDEKRTVFEEQMLMADRKEKVKILKELESLESHMKSELGSLEESERLLKAELAKETKAAASLTTNVTGLLIAEFELIFR